MKESVLQLEVMGGVGEVAALDWEGPEEIDEEGRAYECSARNVSRLEVGEEGVAQECEGAEEIDDEGRAYECSARIEGHMNVSGFGIGEEGLAQEWECMKEIDKEGGT